MAILYCANATSTEVQAKIDLAVAGDTVQIPAGSATWAANSVSFSGITVKGTCTAEPTLTKGAGTSSTVIALSGTFGQPEITMSKHATRKTTMSGIHFTTDGTHNGDPVHDLLCTGSWLGYEPIILRNNTFDMTGGSFIHHDSPGGLIISHNTILGTWNTFLLTVKCLFGDGLASWTTADSMGALDTTGKLNCYLENNTIFQCSNGLFDADDQCRMVDRYNDYTWSTAYQSHGMATSPYGSRHYEIYRNAYLAPSNIDPTYGSCGQWIYPFITDGSSNPNTSFSSNVVAGGSWIRGATGVIYENAYDDFSTSCWGSRSSIIFSIRGIEDNIGYTFPGGPGTIAYPCPHQIGQNHNGSSTFTDPVYMWGNTGAFTIAGGFRWGNPYGLTFSDFWQSGRDYILSGGDGKGSTGKSGYTAYTFPHPLLAEDTPPAASSILLSQVLL